MKETTPILSMTLLLRQLKPVQKQISLKANIKNYENFLKNVLSDATK